MVHLDYAKFIDETERIFRYKSVRIPYIYLKSKNKNSRLLISFGCLGGRYNRIRNFYPNLLNKFDLLYLRDNKGYHHKGVFYLVEAGNFDIEKAYTELILKIMHESNKSKDSTYCLGSSMGGFASLYYTYKLELGKAVAICPVILFSKVANREEYFEKVYQSMIGRCKTNLNKYILNQFNKKVKSQVHIILCNEDCLVTKAGLWQFVKRIIKHNNIFEIESLKLDFDNPHTPHLNMALSMHKKQIMQLFDRALIKTKKNYQV